MSSWQPSSDLDANCQPLIDFKAAKKGKKKSQPVKAVVSQSDKCYPVSFTPRAVTVQADTGVEADIMRMFDEVDRTLGVVTNLINNAGIHGPRGRLDALSAADIDRVLDVNVRGYFICAREAIKRMSTKHGGSGGAIVNVSSGSARLGNPNDGVLYAASKGAVNSLTIGLSQEVAAEGIRVNTVAPGLTATDMPPLDKIETQGPAIPIGRVAEAKEVAEAIVWLISDKASYTAGANIRVGGGRI